MANRDPSDVQHTGYASKQIADQKGSHIGSQLRVEDVPLAVDFLQARTVPELANRNVKHAQPDKVDCNQGHGGKPDDNLCAFGPGVSWGFRRGLRAERKRSTHSETCGLAVLERDNSRHCRKIEEGRKSVIRSSKLKVN